MVSITSKYKNNNKKKGLLDISTPKEFLVFLLVGGGIVAAVAISPALLAPAIFISQFQKQNVKQKKKFSNTCYYLKQKGLIKTNISKGEYSISLTRAGMEKAIKHYVDMEMDKTNKGRKWSGRWWIVMFDIPSDQRVKRNAMRRLIKKLGMHQLQKSVWIYPFDCSKEIQLVKNYFDLSDEYLRIVITNNMGDDKKLRKLFKI